MGGEGSGGGRPEKLDFFRKKVNIFHGNVKYVIFFNFFYRHQPGRDGSERIPLPVHPVNQLVVRDLLLRIPFKKRNIIFAQSGVVQLTKSSHHSRHASTRSLSCRAFIPDVPPPPDRAAARVERMALLGKMPLAWETQKRLCRKLKRF